MWARGKLIVFEGPDGVGKSTLTQKLTGHLEQTGVSVVSFSFPGRAERSLGKLVYALHHNPLSLEVDTLTESSRQTLHIAAHLDAIERVIVPALQAGRCVVLDRFWWSTWVYGITGGARADVLRALLEAEKAQWGEVLPTVAFLVTRTTSLRAGETNQQWHDMAHLYQELAADETSRHSVQILNNDQGIEETWQTVLKALDAIQARSEPPTETNEGQTVELAPHQEKRALVKPVKAHPAKAYPAKLIVNTEVYDTYWKFAVERQAIFFRRLCAQQEPWTEDPILQQHKFTNAYRASDRVSQFLIRHVIYRDGQDIKENPDDIFFRILLFKFFNRISTWQNLEHEFGTIDLDEYTFTRYDQALMGSKERGERIFSSAYIMPTGVSGYGYSAKHRNLLKLLERMIEDSVPWRLTELKTMREAFELLRSYPMMGNFLAYQYVIDLNYSPLTNFSETEFIVPGPGARDGIAKCFLDRGDLSEADVIRWVTERQNSEFERLGLQFQDLWGRPLQLIDCQNLFCEVDKYARMAHPTVKGLSGRTRIKQKFQSSTDSLDYWYPPKWGINERVLEDRNRECSDSDLQAMTLPF